MKTARFAFFTLGLFTFTAFALAYLRGLPESYVWAFAIACIGYCTLTIILSVLIDLKGPAK